MRERKARTPRNLKEKEIRTQFDQDELAGCLEGRYSPIREDPGTTFGYMKLILYRYSRVCGNERISEITNSNSD